MERAEYRICEYCGCEVPAMQRFCCDAGRDADRAANSARTSDDLSTQLNCALEELRCAEMEINRLRQSLFEVMWKWAKGVPWPDEFARLSR